MTSTPEGTSIGVAVIGAGMAGRAHAQGYRSASTVYDSDLPPVRLVAIADAHEPFAKAAAQRFGYERAETSWQAVAEAPDVDAVSVVVANPLHREIVEGLLAAGKHVLCEKPLAPTVEDAAAMVAAAEATDRVAAVGFTFRRSPAISAIREQSESGGVGRVLHFHGHYWCDYGFNPAAPMSWRYKGPPGSGALADIGSHVVDTAEYLCGPVMSVRGAVLSTHVTKRPVAVGAVVGHAVAEVSDRYEAVENDDVATFTVTFAGGAVGTLSVSRIAFGHPNSFAFEVFGESGAAAFDLAHASEFALADQSSPAGSGGYRRVLIGPGHPYIAGGLPMDFPGVGYGQNDQFIYQARAFLDQIAGIDRLPPCPPLSHGVHNLRVLRAVAEAAEGDGRAVPVPTG
jgi:predicted dehydrogenase